MSQEKFRKMDPVQAMELELIEKNRNINETILIGGSPVQRFYDGAVVFITGGSGFLGKQLIEKLFRSCKIKKLFLLLRSKDHKTVKSRLNELLKDPLYEYLHKTQPDFAGKIVPVSGDITKVRLGIEDECWQVISQEVNVIVHSAATINFNEPLKSAVLTNVRGTLEVALLARAVKNLKTFVHVSTAYSHATARRVKQDVMEQFYKSPMSPELLIQLVEQLDEKISHNFTTELLTDWPNTYSFTKAVAEEVIRTVAADLPVCIVRPAIVLCSFREPPGWADKTTVYGPIGFIMGACLGGLHVMYGNPNIHLDTVPVDLVNNAIITAGYQTGIRRENKETEIKIYTVTSSRRPMKLGELHHFLENDARHLQSPKMLWYGYVIMTQSKLLLFLLVWFLHYIPGYLVDGVLMLLGKKPKVNKLFARAYKHNTVYHFYMTNDWRFDDKNLTDMYKKLSPADRIMYNSDTGIVDYKNYLAVCCIGTRKYVLKDGLQNTEYAIKKQRWLRIANYVYLFIYAYLLWKLFIFVIGCCINLISN